MSKHTNIVYRCDYCGNKLPTCRNNVTIVTTKDASSFSWERLVVTIQYRSGLHKEGTEERAELCQLCATKLLADAAKRVAAGERATKGSESSKQEDFE